MFLSDESGPTLFDCLLCVILVQTRTDLLAICLNFIRIADYEISDRERENEPNDGMAEENSTEREIPMLKVCRT